MEQFAAVGPERFTAVPTEIGGCSPAILISVGCSSDMSPIFPQWTGRGIVAGNGPEKQELLWKPQRFVQLRIVKNVPEMIDDLAISPKLIRKHKLDRSQHECEKCVVAVQQRGFYRRRTDEIA